MSTIREIQRPIEQYDQSHPYHPYARQIDESQWVVEEPGMDRPLGFVHSRPGEYGLLEFVVFPWHDPSITVRPFDGSHPTLFHAVSWLRWHEAPRR
jgi:hypothetical protein